MRSSMGNLDFTGQDTDTIMNANSTDDIIDMIVDSGVAEFKDLIDTATGELLVPPEELKALLDQVVTAGGGNDPDRSLRDDMTPPPEEDLGTMMVALVDAGVYTEDEVAAMEADEIAQAYADLTGDVDPETGERAAGDEDPGFPVSQEEMVQALEDFKSEIPGILAETALSDEEKVKLQEEIANEIEWAKNNWDAGTYASVEDVTADAVAQAAEIINDYDTSKGG